MSKRTDCHRPGAIVPTDYSHLLCYSLPGMSEYGEPPFNVEEARALCAVPGWQTVGSLGTCGVCGASHRHGDLFRHAPTGAIVTMGHECAAKYEMLADRRDWDAFIASCDRNRRARIEERLRDEQEEGYYAGDPSMRAILAVEHPILADMRQKVRRYGGLSEKQIAFAVRLAAEAWTPAAPPVVVDPGHHVGKVGERVSVKATLEHCAAFERVGFRGEDETGYVWIFQTDAGDALVWFTGQPPCNRPTERSAGSGRVYGGPVPCTLKATIKAHGERDGRKQTTATRCTVKWEKGLPQTWDEHLTAERAAREAAWAAADAERAA